MIASRCFIDSVSPGMLLLTIMAGFVNCLQPVEHLGSPQVGGTVAQSISAQGSVSSLPEEPEHFFSRESTKGKHEHRLTPAHLERRAGRSLVQKIHRAKAREDRPSIIMFEDKTCDIEIGGVFLPMNAALEKDSCTKVTPIDELSTVAGNRIIAAERNRSLKLFTDITDIRRLHIVLHFGNDCRGGEDDFMKVSVDKKHFEGLQASECVQAYNAEQVQTLYLMMLNTDSIESWPKGVNEKGWLFYAGIVAGAVTLLAIIVFLAARLNNMRSTKKMFSEEEDPVPWTADSQGEEWAEEDEDWASEGNEQPQAADVRFVPQSVALSQSRTRYADKK